VYPIEKGLVEGKRGKNLPRLSLFSPIRERAIPATICPREDLYLRVVSRNRHVIALDI
jgi:hypothetical protein